ncbi:hypothetical protein SUNI508_14070 [Seiridium unicorne]|uniref:Uncharacterized protein n=1 Tax=Seiridium unicorne TaxID=138068 RepID=A0ABR2V4M4_9PEZI
MGPLKTCPPKIRTLNPAIWPVLSQPTHNEDPGRLLTWSESQVQPTQSTRTWFWFLYAETVQVSCSTSSRRNYIERAQRLV